MYPTSFDDFMLSTFATETWANENSKWSVGLSAIGSDSLISSENVGFCSWCWTAQRIVETNGPSWRLVRSNNNCHEKVSSVDVNKPLPVHRYSQSIEQCRGCCALYWMLSVYRIWVIADKYRADWWASCADCLIRWMTAFQVSQSCPMTMMMLSTHHDPMALVMAIDVALSY